MEALTLKRKLSTYVSDSGRLRNVSEDLLFEVLHAWEEWTGTAKDFYATIGFSSKQMAKLIGKAKKLKREGHFGTEAFKEISTPTNVSESSPPRSSDCQCIELQTPKGQLIRFPHVEQLVDYLSKVS